MPKIDLEKVLIYDIETLVNCIVFNFKDYATKKKFTFVLYDHKDYNNQAFECFKFIRSCTRAGYSFLGFNNVNFDSQVVHYFYDWCSQKTDPLYEFENNYIIEQLYKKAQQLISIKTHEERFEIQVPEYKLFAPQIDLFKQLHFDRKQKSTSLKWLQFTMRRSVIREMDHPHDVPLELHEIQEMVEYCWEDVDSTEDFFSRIKFESEVRLDLGNEFDLNLINASEPKMVREIFGKFLCEQMKMEYKDLKQLKTFRKFVAFKDIIFPYVKFITPEFQTLLEDFKNVKVNTTPNAEGPETKFEYKFKFKNMDIYLGLGGIHACVDPGVYTHKPNERIEDADGTSFYPFLAIKNNLRPEHLGEAYNVVYPMMFERRMQYPKKDPRNYIYKIILNSAYGLSKEKNTYLYDPKYTYAVTINGQLSLLMLVEALNIAVPGIEFIQMNTDGITYKYDTKYEDHVRKVCSWWEGVTKIGLEYAYYEKMVIMDVNNYLAVKEGFGPDKDAKDYIKKKGLFDTTIVYHKNPSNLIIPKALEQYYVYNVPIEEYIKNPENSVFDYCAGVKKKSDFKINLIQNFQYAELIREQQKVCRFIVGGDKNDSGILVKDFNDGRRNSIVAKTLVQPLDIIKPEFTEAKHYKIDYNWYEKKAREVINTITPTAVQTELF